MKLTNEIKEGLAALKTQHQTNWVAFTEKLAGILSIIGARNTEEDISEHVDAAAFIAAGFSAAESDALLFVLTEDCMGQSVNNLEMVDRWFCYCA